GITNRFVNTMITALHAPEWETLLQRIGADAMLHLLLKISLFISLPNECLCQVIGEPLIFIPPPTLGGFLNAESSIRVCKRKRDSPHETQPRKRLKLVRSVSGNREQPIKGTARQAVTLPVER
ncbi:hypothetical protein HYDPIDRAFT_85271, partial [Hydnomerulius pinastri MD-312]